MSIKLSIILGTLLAGVFMFVMIKLHEISESQYKAYNARGCDKPIMDPGIKKAEAELCKKLRSIK